MSDTKSASEYKPAIEVGTIIHLLNAKSYPRRDRYERWDGERWVEITEEMRKKR